MMIGLFFKFNFTFVFMKAFTFSKKQLEKKCTKLEASITFFFDKVEASMSVPSSVD